MNSEHVDMLITLVGQLDDATANLAEVRSNDAARHLADLGVTRAREDISYMIGVMAPFRDDYIACAHTMIAQLRYDRAEAQSIAEHMMTELAEDADDTIYQMNVDSISDRIDMVERIITAVTNGQ